jgi:hypothetical protein
MLDPQVVVKLFPQVCVGTEVVEHKHGFVLVILVPQPLREQLKELARWL